MDRDYDITRVYDECAECDVLPLIPLRQTSAHSSIPTALYRVGRR